ncbi:MAG: hypothetical protein SFZ02_21355 [bacterium]|nr:hypothetical protein [bacterium]
MTYKNYDIRTLLISNPLEAWVRGDVQNIKALGQGKFMAQAPWRSDNRPSVLVTPKTGESGTFYDFGARDFTGSTINWLMYTRNLTKYEAICMLGEHANIPLAIARETTVIEGDHKTYKSPSMEQVNAYHAHLNLAMPYFESRGINAYIAKRAKLGYFKNFPVYVKIGVNQWLGSPFMTVPVYVIPNFIGFNVGIQVVRGIHLRYDNMTAREKIREMWKLGSRHAQTLVRWLNIVDKDPVDVIHDYLFGQRYTNVRGSQQKLFNGNRLLAMEENALMTCEIPNLIIGEGPLPAYVAESAGYPVVGLPNNKLGVDPKRSFAKVTGKIVIVTDDDQAGEDRANRIIKECGEDRCVRIHPGKKQLDGMVLDGSLAMELAKWHIFPNHQFIASKPF